MKSKAPHSPVKPQLIDLEAENITLDDVERAAEPPPSPEPPPLPPFKPAKSSRGSAKWLVLALLAGALGGAWIYKDLLSSYMPSNEILAAKSRIGMLEAQARTLAEQLAAVEGKSDQMNIKIGTVVADVQGVADKTASFDTRLAAAEAGTKSLKENIEKLKSAPIAIPSTNGAPVDSSALAVLAQRVDTLEKDVGALRTASTPTDQQAVATTLSQSLSDLKAKIAAGAAYREELDRITRMVPAAAGLDTLASHADQGLPTPQGLAKELTDLIPLLPKPEIDVIVPDNSSTEGFWKMLKGLVTIRRIGETDWPGLAAQCAALADSGDLAQAIEKIDKAEGTMPSAISSWRERAAARILLQASLEQTSKAVLRQVTSMGATP